MTRSLEKFTTQELEEVFAHPPIREVAFEIRFAPRLRVPAELWRLQDQLVEEYPEVATESLFQPSGAALSINVFQNPANERVIKVSQQNFVIAFTRYTRFEDFKDEALQKTKQFCATFGITALLRVGLRYVNNIVLPAADSTVSLLKFVRPFADLQRLPAENIDQFVTEVRLRHRDSMVMLRGVLLAPLEDGRKIYVLDIDCYSQGPETAERVPDLLDSYHDIAQRFFLDHVTEEFKAVMRGQK